MARKRRKLKVSSLFFLLIIFLVIGLFVYLYLSSKENLEFTKEINLNSEAYSTDCIDEDKYTVVTEKEEIDTSSIGTIEKEIEVKDKMSLTKTVICKYTITDKEEPTIKGVKDLLVEVNDSLDLLENIEVTDNSSEEIKATVEGEYDFDKVGSYTLYYKATDKSGNTKKEKFMLNVVQKTSKDVSDSTPKNYFTTSKGFTGYEIDGITYIDGILVANKTYKLPSSYNPGSLTTETRAAMNEMFTDANSRGLNIYLSSGFRSYDTQEAIYNRYVNKDGQAEADTYSARPGHSEHQTGLAFDVNDIDYTFDNTPEAKWLNDNCYKYGFILRYPKGKTNETGYIYESWHFRYVGVELATKLYNNGNWLTLEDYFGITSKYE